MPTFLPAAPILLEMAGAAATAEEGSTMIFMRSQMVFIASTISASVTVTMSSTYFLRMEKVSGERVARRPSAIVSPEPAGAMAPEWRER